MHPQWRAFLADRDARFDPRRADHRGCVVAFGDEAAERRAVDAGPVVADLSHLGLIAARGAGAVQFLQSQLANDINAVDAERSQLSVWCSPKGRALAVARALLYGGVHCLQLPVDLLEATLAGLRKYILRAPVVLEELANRVCFGLAGARADRLLQKALGAPPPQQPNGVTHSDACVAIRLPGPSLRFALLGEVAPMTTLWRALSADATPVGVGAWRLLEIRAGAPTLYPDTVGAFTPQMLNLQALDAISFTKGCYPGQEVVARTHYLGALKRRMYAIRAADGPGLDLRPGGVVVSPGSAAPQRAGRIVDMQKNGAGQWEGLAVLEIAAAQRDDLFLDSEQGTPARLAPLPYAVEG